MIIVIDNRRNWSSVFINVALIPPIETFNKKYLDTNYKYNCLFGNMFLFVKIDFISAIIMYFVWPLLLFFNLLDIIIAVQFLQYHPWF